jgi:hypothetical protein
MLRWPNQPIEEDRIMQAGHTAQSAPPYSIHAHRAPDPAPVDDPMPDPFEAPHPHPHHQPGHLPHDDEPVPDPNPS